MALKLIHKASKFFVIKFYQIEYSFVRLVNFLKRDAGNEKKQFWNGTFMPVYTKINNLCEQIDDEGLSRGYRRGQLNVSEEEGFPSQRILRTCEVDMGNTDSRTYSTLLLRRPSTIRFLQILWCLPIMAPNRTS